MYIQVQSVGRRSIRTPLLSSRCLAAQLLCLTRRLEVGLGMLYAALLRIPIDDWSSLAV